MKIVRGNLFSAPKGSLLLHSCNCQGSWGAGIAKQFEMRFPFAYKDYQEICKTQTPYELLGMFRVFEDGGYFIGSLFVSSGYGKKKDSQRDILFNTHQALTRLVKMAKISGIKPQIHMPKINSGLFNVPWEHTEQLIKLDLELNDFDVTVYEL